MKKDQGGCYEVDKETRGERYIKKTYDINCRPNKTSFFFDYQKGDCLEVGTFSNGNKYISEVALDNCQSKKTQIYLGIINEKYGCYLIDPETQGRSFYKKLNDKNCNVQDTNNYYWKPLSETKGECLTQDLAGNLQKAPTEKCRPETVVYSFVLKSTYRGECFETHPDGPQKFINRTSKENCRPEKTVYAFQKKNQTKGFCYEVDEETQGSKYINKVRIDFCKK